MAGNPLHDVAIVGAFNTKQAKVLEGSKLAWKVPTVAVSEAAMADQARKGSSGACTCSTSSRSLRRIVRKPSK